MKRTIVAVAALGLAFAGAVALAEGPAFRVEVQAVRVARANYDHDFHMQAFGASEETGIALLVHGEGIVGLDEAASKVTALKDDKGADLTEIKGMSKLKVGDAAVSKDAKAVLVVVSAPNAPTAGSRSVHLDASLGVVTANGTEKKECRVAFEADAKVEVGSETLVLSQMKDTGQDGLPFFVVWKSKTPLHWLASMTLTDENGADVRCGYSAGSETIADQKKTYWASLRIAKKIKKGTLVLEVRKGLKTVTVPVALDIGIGG